MPHPSRAWAVALCIGFACCRRPIPLVAIIDNVPSTISINQDSQAIKLPIRDIVQITSIIKVKTQDSLFISSNNILTPTEQGYILTDRKLSWALLLDTAGNVISEIGKLGMGKGTYPSIEALRVDPYTQEILIYSNEKQAILRYAQNGSFIKETTLPFYGYSFGILDQQHLVFYLNQNTNDLSGQYNLLITDREGNIGQRLFPIRLLPREVYTYSGFLESSGTRHLVAASFSDSIFELTGNSFHPKYVTRFSGGGVPEEARTSTHKLIKTFPTASFIERIKETNDYLVVRYMEREQQRIAVYNKQTGQAIGPNQISEKYLERLLYNVIGSDDQHFYALLNVESFDLHYRPYQDRLDSLRQFDEKLYTTCLGATPFDNPIIVQFKLKFP